MLVNWDKAIRLFLTYEATVLTNGKKTAVEKAESRARGIRYLLTQMPDLASKDIEDITPQIWWNALQVYKKSNRDFKGGRATWGDLLNWKKYKDLRAYLIYARDGYKCHYCHAKYPDDNVTLTVDHVTPLSQDGADYLDNLVCCCAPCNRAKLNNPEQFQEWLKRRFNHTGQ